MMIAIAGMMVFTMPPFQWLRDVSMLSLRAGVVICADSRCRSRRSPQFDFAGAIPLPRLSPFNLGDYRGLGFAVSAGFACLFLCSLAIGRLLQ